jgi:hypothetical protein
MSTTPFDSIYSGAYALPAIEQEPYQPEIYRYFVVDMITDELVAEIPMTNVTYSQRVNSVGELSGIIPAIDTITDVDIYWGTMPSARSLYVVRDSTVVWGGIIWTRTYDVSNRSLAIRAETWESYLYKRHIWHTFEGKSNKDAIYGDDETDPDQLLVIKNLLVRADRDFSLDATPEEIVVPWPDQADVRLAVQETVSGYESEEIWFYGDELKTFGEAIEELANKENGFEWNFHYRWRTPTAESPNGRFARRIEFRTNLPHLKPPLQAKPPDDELNKPGINTWAFEHPGNIINVSFEEDASEACTRSIVVGGHERAADWKPRGSWNNEEYDGSIFPLIENVESSRHATETDPDRLNRLARIYGRRSAPPIRSWSVTVNGSMDPVIGSYRLGDWCRVIVDDPFVNQSMAAQAELSNAKFGNGYVKRIMGWQVTVPGTPAMPESVQLELEDDWNVDFTG